MPILNLKRALVFSTLLAVGLGTYQRARVQERPLLSSAHAPEDTARTAPPLRTERANSEMLFDGVGKNSGSAAHPNAPGRVRPDAPAQHELARRNIQKLVPESLIVYATPMQPDPFAPLDHRIRDTIRLSDDTRSDDFPVILSNPKDREEVWATWVSYSGRRDQIRLCRRDPDTKNWGTWNIVPGVTGDVWRPSLVHDVHGRLWVIWAQQELYRANFDLYARWFDKEHWGPLHRLTSGPEGDFNQHAVRSGNGTVHLVWQGFREGQADIFYLSYDGAGWSQPVQISESSRNDWTPSVATDSEGRVHFVWDTYDRGNYDVVMRTLAGETLTEIQEIANSQLFEARPSALVDSDERLWVAYEVGEPGWGKDQGLLVDQARQPGSMLNLERRIEVCVLERGDWSAAKPALVSLFPPRARRHYVKSGPSLISNPKLSVDERGRVTILLRKLEGQYAYAEYWQAYAVTMTPDGWKEPALLPYSAGRLSMEVSVTPDASGGLWFGWPRDNHPSFSVMANLPEETVIENVYAGRYDPATEPGNKLGAIEEPRFERRAAGHANEAGDVTRIRQWRTRVAGKNLQILRGDTHRHTELSMDLRGVPDGSVLDFYRYMLDAASMDFGLITDHQNGADREYWWWLEEKLADLFHAPESYIALFGYERSANYPDGHRNIVHARRGVTPVPFFQPLDSPIQFRLHNGALGVIRDDTRILYDEIRATGGVSIPHTSATSMGTDWRDNDPEVETLVEIYQGDRHSYEAKGAPLSDMSARQATLTQIRPKGYISNAWGKGYRLGVIASSDHLSTHISYAMVWAEERSREAVLEAMRQRRAYAATDNIVLEFWIGNHFMGEEFDSEGVPAIRIKAVGTRPFADIQILRNNRSIYQNPGGSQDVDLTYQDLESGTGLNFYYARVIQQDGQTAWSSPIWVNVQ